MPNKVNKGEWAELFVFLKALADGKIHAADEDLKKVDALFYRILSAIKSEQDVLKEYRRDDANIILLEDGSECLEIPIKEFEDYANVVLEGIRSGSGTFEIPQVEPFLSKIKIKKIKANSDTKKTSYLKSMMTLQGLNLRLAFQLNPTLEVNQLY